jgi:hypothetical protein
LASPILDPLEPVEQVRQARAAYREQGCHRVLRRSVSDAVRQVKLKNEWPGPALPHPDDLPGKLRVCHAVSLRGREDHL